MEISDLRVFNTVAEEKSISRAAERLDYVQSNVTARIRKLESEIGVQLFHRHPKGVTLTDKGMTFRNYAVMILNMAEEALKEVQETAYPSGPLAIGLVETVTCGNFMNTLSEFQSLHPHVSLTLITGTTPQLLSKVLNHQLDGAFVTGPVQSPHLSYEYSLQDEVVLLTQMSNDAPPDLAKTKWVVSPEGCPFRSILEEWLRSEGLSLDNRIEIGSLETLLSCVRSGLAATLLPRSVLSGGYEHLGTYPIPERYRYTETSLIRRKDRFTGKAYQAFVELINSSGL